MKNWLLWDTTQREMAVFIDDLGQPILPIVKGQVPFLLVKFLEDETDILSRNVSTE
jgi:hypothetical protein